MFAFSPFMPLVSKVSADENQSLLCDVFPFINNIRTFNIYTVCGTPSADLNKENLGTTAVNIARIAASFIFVGIIIVAVYIVIKAAVKYIRSEGDDKKIEEASKAIKSVFVGLIALFIGIIGLVLILVLFDALGAINDAPSVDTIIDNQDDLNNVEVDRDGGQ